MPLARRTVAMAIAVRFRDKSLTTMGVCCAPRLFLWICCADDNSMKAQMP